MTPTALRDRARELRQRATVFEQELRQHAQGYQVLRIWNSDWSQHRQDVLTLIWNRLHDPVRGPQPSPQPLSHNVGEGL